MIEGQHLTRYGWLGVTFLRVCETSQLLAIPSNFLYNENVAQNASIMLLKGGIYYYRFSAMA
jgi:hypothetical protein